MVRGSPAVRRGVFQGLEARTGTGESGKIEDGRDGRPQRDEAAKKHEEAETKQRRRPDGNSQGMQGLAG